MIFKYMLLGLKVKVKLLGLLISVTIIRAIANDPFLDSYQSWNMVFVLVTVYFSIGLLQIPDGILKQSRGATPRVGVSKCHRVSVANQLKNITVTHLYHSHAYLIFTLTTFEMDFTCLYRNRYFVLKYEP